MPLVFIQFGCVCVYHGAWCLSHKLDFCAEWLFGPKGGGSFWPAWTTVVQT